MQSANSKNYLKPDQWFNDSRFNLIIKPKSGLDASCKSEYRVQSLIFQMKSPFFAKQIERIYSATGSEPPILELPDTFRHSVYEDIHMEIMGYPVRKLRREHILDYYYIAYILQLEERSKYLRFVFDDSVATATKIWQIYVLACKLKDEDLREELLKFLESRTFKPLLQKDGEAAEVSVFLKEITEDDFKFLVKIHNDRRHNAQSDLQKEYLNQHQIFTLTKAFTQLRGLPQERARSFCKEMMVMNQLSSDDYEIISKSKFFSARDEAQMLQMIFKKRFASLRKESELIKSQVPRLEEEILDLRQRLENLGVVTFPKVYQKTKETFDVSGHDYLTIDKMELPRGRYLFTVNFYGKHKQQNAGMFWMYLYLYKNGVNLNSYPNSGWYGYNPNGAYTNPYQLINVFNVEAESETIEFKGYSGGSYDAILTNISMVAKEIIEEVEVRQTPGRPE